MRLFFLTSVLTMLIFTGCETPKAPHKPIKDPVKQEVISTPVSVTAASDVDGLLQYASYLKKLNANDLNRELETAKQKPKSDSSKMEQAILYSMPGLATRDDSKALLILDTLIKESNSQSIKSLALMLTTFVTENKRLEEALQTTTGKLKDEQKQSSELQQKLEALKSIEKSLSERDRLKKPVTKNN